MTLVVDEACEEYGIDGRTVQVSLPHLLEPGHVKFLPIALRSRRSQTTRHNTSSANAKFHGHPAIPVLTKLNISGLILPGTIGLTTTWLTAKSFGGACLR